MNLKGHIQLLLSVLLLLALIACNEGHANREPQGNVRPRFTNPDSTIPISGSVVLDNQTELMWLRDDNCIKTNYPDKTARDGLVSYKNAVNFIAGLNKGQYPKCSYGYSGWRLPTKKELRELLGIAESPINTWISRRTLDNIKFGSYWFSPNENGTAVKGSFWGWYYNNVYPYLRSGCYVWPVRSENGKSKETLKVENKKQE